MDTIERGDRVELNGRRGTVIYVTHLYFVRFDDDDWKKPVACSIGELTLVRKR